jgi:hypothetical protein
VEEVVTKPFARGNYVIGVNGKKKGVVPRNIVCYEKMLGSTFRICIVDCAERNIYGTQCGNQRSCGLSHSMFGSKESNNINAWYVS